MITRATLSTIEQGLPKYRSMLAGNSAYLPFAFESLATVLVGAGGAANVTFSSIPNTYTHLQIRGVGRSADAANTADTIRIRLNGDSGSNYSTHAIGGDGATAYVAQAAASQTSGYGAAIARNGVISATFGGTIIDILDYANTNKNKTIRDLGGADFNGSGNMILASTAWLSTSAVTSVTLFAATGTNFVQNSRFALYGIRAVS